jgi:hypothetical protein
VRETKVITITNLFSVVVVLLLSHFSIDVAFSKDRYKKFGVNQEMTPFENFHVLPNKRGANQRYIKISGNDVKVKIVGSRRNLYKVKLTTNGRVEPGTFLISKKYAHKAFDIQAVRTVIKNLEDIAHVGEAPCPKCDALRGITEDIRPPRPKPQVQNTSPGASCQVLKGKDLTVAGQKQKLKNCFQDIRSRIIKGARNSNGSINRKKLFCNMFTKLNPDEQNFAGLVFTGMGEAGIISSSKVTSPPKYQEQLFAMNSIKNRLSQLKSDKPSMTSSNALDVSLFNNQYSMYNSGIINDFKHYFEPNYNTRAHSKKVDDALSAFVALKKSPQNIDPHPASSKIGNYFNPHGMAKISSMGSQNIQKKERKKIQKLIRQGKLPKDYPRDRIAPRWNFSRLEMVPTLSYNGTQVRKKRPYMHVFYKSKKKLFYGSTKDSWRARCSK